MPALPGWGPSYAFRPYAAMSETSSNCWKTITPARKQVRLSSLIYNAFLLCRGNGVINEAGCCVMITGFQKLRGAWDRSTGVRSKHQLGA